MKTEVKINVISIVLSVIIIFLLGYFLHSGQQTKKEIKALDADIRIHQEKVDSLNTIVLYYKAKTGDYNTLITVNNLILADKDKKITALNNQLHNLKSQSNQIPTNQKYDMMQVWLGFDSLPKPYVFSGRQIDTLYWRNEMLGVVLDEAETCVSYIDILTFNMEEGQRLNALQDSTILTLEKKDIEKDIIIADKDKQLKTLKKAKNKGSVLTYVIGGLAALLGVIAVAK